MESGSSFYDDNIVKISLMDETFHKVSNKGVHPKWHKGDNWIKMDLNRYEGLAETIVSDMLIYSNIDRHFSYDPVVERRNKSIYFTKETYKRRKR